MLAGKGKLAALEAAMAGKGKKKPAAKKPMPLKKKGRDMGALAAFSKGDY